VLGASKVVRGPALEKGRRKHDLRIMTMLGLASLALVTLGLACAGGQKALAQEAQGPNPAYDPNAAPEFEPGSGTGAGASGQYGGETPSSPPVSPLDTATPKASASSAASAAATASVLPDTGGSFVPVTPAVLVTILVLLTMVLTVGVVTLKRFFG
jgi:hypothetical protein